MSADAHPTIWSAAKQGDAHVLRTLLARSPEAVHHQADDGCTALHHAAFGGSDEAVALLLGAGSDLVARDFSGHTTLHYAAFGGHANAFRQLLAAGADLYAVDDSLTTLIHAAAASGSKEIVDLLLAEGLAADAANLYGELPVHRAAQRNRVAIVQQLLNLGSEPNPVDRYGMSLMHKAAIGDALETAMWLMDQDCDSSARDLVGDTPLHSAASMGRLKMVAALLDRGVASDDRNDDQATALHHAATAGHADIVLLLIDRGADASATDALGRTPLHLAAMRGHTDIVLILIQLNESLEAMLDGNGYRPVDLAALYGHTAAWDALSSKRICDTPGAVTPAAIKSLVNRPVSHGAMMVWYLGHSGWAIRTQNHLFILDYAPGEPDGAEASLANGKIDPAEWGDIPIFVIVSHHHGDHFDQRILQWDHPQMRRVYGWDAPEDLPGFRFIGQEFKRIGNVMIAAIPATDAGSAFLVEADGVSFYHAGDHAASQIPLEPEFAEGIDWLADQFAPVQAAFLPVFGCGLPSPDTLQEGNAFTIERLNPDAVFPMHIGWTATFYRRFERWIRQSNMNVGLGIADQPGDRFRIRNGHIEQIWT